MPGPAREHPDEARLAAARPSRLAWLVNAASDPALVVAAVSTFVATRYSHSVLAGLAWTALTIAFCVVIPYAVLLLLLRGGVVGDRHILRREQRLWPNIGAILSVAVGLALLAWWGAPRELVALVLAELASLGAISLVTLRSKASLHVAVTAGACGVVAVVQAHPLWWVGAVAATTVVGWARARSGRHSVVQVVAGAVIGAAATAGVYLLVT